MPVIVIEGIDGAGKSTLFESIKEKIPHHFDRVFVHKGVPEYEDPEKEYLQQLSWLRKNHFMVSDRYHVGELIYGPIYRGYSMTEGEWFTRIESRLDELKAVKVILLPPLQTVIERLEKRGEDYLQPEHVEKVWNFYNDFVDKNPTWLRLDSNNERVADMLVKKAMEMK